MAEQRVQADDDTPRELVPRGDYASASGFVAGRDLLDAFGRVMQRVEELVGVLETRAARIGPELAKHYVYTPVDDFLARFGRLHATHVESLRAGSLVLAHEALNGIQDLSSELEGEEFWTDHRINRPNEVYELTEDAFLRGPLICAYMVGDMRRHSPLYTPDIPLLGPRYPDLYDVQRVQDELALEIRATIGRYVRMLEDADEPWLESSR